MPLDHLFDAELHYRSGLAPLRPAEDGEGELIGSGDGAVDGDRLAGSLRWTLFEVPGELVCKMAPVAAIETVDGAHVRLEARGYARRATTEDRLWKVAATLRFETEDERYGWLDGSLGVWEGEFDADTHRARYRAFIQTPVTTERRMSIPGRRRGRARLDALSPSERKLYDWILRAFATGTPPSAATLADAASDLDVHVDAALAAFARDDLVHHDPNTGAILVAYPFSGIPRGHRVRIDGTVDVEAMCAIDALGIAPMLDRQIEITSRDPHTGREVWVRLDPSEGAWWEPRTAVVLDGRLRGDAPSFRSCCTVLNFFESGESALHYLIANPDVSGQPIQLPDAIELGRTLFGDLLPAPDHD